MFDAVIVQCLSRSISRVVRTLRTLRVAQQLAKPAKKGARGGYLIRSWCFSWGATQWTVGSRGEMESGVDWRRMAGPGAQDVSRSNSLDPHLLSSPLLSSGAGVDNPSPPAPPLGAGQRRLLSMLERRERGPATFRALFLTQSPSPHPLKKIFGLSRVMVVMLGRQLLVVWQSGHHHTPQSGTPDRRTDLWQQGLFLLGGASHVHLIYLALALLACNACLACSLRLPDPKASSGDSRLRYGIQLSTVQAEQEVCVPLPGTTCTVTTPSGPLVSFPRIYRRKGIMVARPCNADQIQEKKKKRLY
jgi:hypothetical protein